MLSDDFKAFKVSVGARVKERRKTLERVMKQVASEIGVSEDALGRLESGTTITLKNLYAVGRVLDTPLAVLIAEEGEATVDARGKIVKKICHILAQRSERDVADVLAIIERVRDIRSRAKPT